jgi:large subunit ribosomal protein L25
MDRLSLKAEERLVLGKKVKNLRKEGKLPGHIYGKKVETEHVTVDGREFLKTWKVAGATAVINLKLGEEKVRPVMVRDVQYNPVSGDLVHIDFYQVNLSEKVKVPVPIEIIGEEPELVKLGEAIVLQTINELEVEALPNDLIEKLEVDISSLKAIDDAITVGQLKFDREKLAISVADEEIVVKLAPAVSAEMEALLEEQAAETAEAAAEEAAEGEGEQKAEGAEGEEEVKEGETPNEKEAEAEEKGSEGGGNDQGQS